MTDSHLSVATIAAYADNALEADARADADRHLAVCAECRSELAGVADLIVDLPTARRSRTWRTWRTVAGTLAAAGVVGVLLALPTRGPDRSVATERTTRPVAASVEIVMPPMAGRGGGLRDGRIVWRSVEPQAKYKVTITDTTGATRWSTETRDTVVVLPPSARVDAGARYYLYVDALRADGWSVPSEPREFTTTP